MTNSANNKDRKTQPFNPTLQRGHVRASRLLIVLVVLGCLGGGYWAWHSGTSGSADAGNTPGSPSGSGAGKRFGGGQGAQPVSVQKAQIQDIRVTVNAIGAIVASNTAVVHAQVNGVLQAISFHEGQQVKAGQTLATIDPRAFQAILGQAQGALARDQAQLENANVDLLRYKDLVSKEAVPQQQLDTQSALVRQLQGTVRVDQATVDSAQLQLSYTRVVAPIGGRVGLKQADLGNIVQASDVNGIVSIAQTRPIALVFAVPSAQVPKIIAGLHANKALIVEALDRNGGKQLALGRVATIDNAIDPATDTIKVKAIFPNTDDSLFPNQSVSVRLQLDTQKNVLAVPQAAVLRGAQGFYVYVVNEDGTVTTRPVKPGVVDKDWMAIDGDVQAGDKVVVDGVDRLRNGAKVEVIDTASKTKPRSEQASSAVNPAKLPTSVVAESVVTGTRVVQQASTQDSDEGSQRHKWADSLSDSERENIKKMTPEERSAWRQKMREQMNKGAAAQPVPSN